MSETFYIKKTAFDDNIFDLSTRESNSFIIGPGELNGPGGLNRDSDLELYGFGSIKWGEGVNQNLYRMLENFACPAKFAGSPPVQVIPLAPADESDLGVGNGITNPVIGQLWYNTTNTTLYNYELTGWETVFKEVQDLLNTHIADDTVHLTADQNDFLDGLTLGSPLLTSTDVNQLIGITTADGTVQDQIDLMVDSRGDTMTGSLTMLDSSAQILFENGHHRISNNDGGGNFNIRIGNEFDTGSPGGTLYTQTGGAIHLLGTHESSNPAFAIFLGDGFSNTVGTNVVFSGTFNFTNDGNLSANGVAPTDPSHLTRKDYVDNNFVNVAGDVMDAGANIQFTGGGEVTGLPTTPVGSTSATSRTYVQNTFAPIISPLLTTNPRSVTFASTDNSTRIATTAFVKSATISKVEVSKMLQTQDEAQLFGAGGWNQFLSGTACNVSGYYNFLMDTLNGNSNSLGLNSRGTWYDMYYVSVSYTPDFYSSAGNYTYSRDAAYTPLAKITNYTSSAITWQCQLTHWLASDDTTYFRILENGVNIANQTKFASARCLRVNKASAVSTTKTLSRTIPAGATYTYQWQGTVTGGWDSGGDASMPRSVTYNRIVF